MFETIRYTVKDQVGHILLARPMQANCISTKSCQELVEALRLAKEDGDVVVVLITSEGRVFSAGGDLNEMATMVVHNDKEAMKLLVEGVAQVSMAMKELPKPVVMSVDGAVAGAAANMVLASDFCIASEKATFIQAFVNIGLVPDGGGLFLLARSVGMNKAIQLAMTGDPVSASEGKALGFVYDVCSSEELGERTTALLAKLKKGPKVAYGAMKQLLWEATLQEWNAYTNREVEVQSRLSGNEDFIEGINAFLEKRKPQFKDPL